MELDDGDIAEPWTLTAADYALVMAKNGANRLGFALLLLFYRAHGQFPKKPTEIEAGSVARVARQLGVEPNGHDEYDTASRTWKRHRAEIRALAGFRAATVADAELLEGCLRDQVAAIGAAPDQLAALLETRCRELSIEPPSADRVDRIIRAAIHAHDERFHAAILDRLAPATRGRLEALLRPEGNEEFPAIQPPIRPRERRLRRFCGCAAIPASRTWLAFRKSWPS